MPKHIVLMGGGSGISHLLPVFTREPDWDISAIVATSDSGGSTWVIRHSYALPAIGDIVKNLAALGGKETSWMTYRHQNGFLSGHTTGNLWLLGLIQSYGFTEGIKKAHTILWFRHTVIPATPVDHDIHIVTNDGIKILWEGPIIQYKKLSRRVKSIELTPKAEASEEAGEALRNADIIILGPWTLYTSLIACLLPLWMKEAFNTSPAQKFFIANAANFPPGHCDWYTLDTYLEEIARLTGIEKFDAILAHDGTGVSEDEIITVRPRTSITTMDILSSQTQEKGGKFDSIKRNTLCHDWEKVVQWIKKIFH